MYGSLRKRLSHSRLPLECPIVWKSLSTSSRDKSGRKRVWSSIPTETASFLTQNQGIAQFTKLVPYNAEHGHSGKATLRRRKPGHKQPRVAPDAIRVGSIPLLKSIPACQKIHATFEILIADMSPYCDSWLQALVSHSIPLFQPTAGMRIVSQAPTEPPIRQPYAAG